MLFMPFNQCFHAHIGLHNLHMGVQAQEVNDDSLGKHSARVGSKLRIRSSDKGLTMGPLRPLTTWILLYFARNWSCIGPLI